MTELALGWFLRAEPYNAAYDLVFKAVCEPPAWIVAVALVAALWTAAVGIILAIFGAGYLYVHDEEEARREGYEEGLKAAAVRPSRRHRHD